MAEAEDYHPLQSKCAAITVLLPYAVWRERDGQPEMFDTNLHATRASGASGFTWHPIDQFLNTLLSQASPRAIVLASPYIVWIQPRDNIEDFVRCFTAAISAVPYSEEIAQGVVDTLLQVASQYEPQNIPVDLWSWLTKRPSLPPICLGRRYGIDVPIVKAVRALKDIEVLKSYLLVVWSEWDTLYSDSFYERCTLIREDFGGIEMRHHWTDLIQRLDHVLAQLDRGLEYIQQHKLQFNEDDLWWGKRKYRELRETLLEMNNRTPFANYAPLYTDSYPGCTQNPARHLCAHSLPRVRSLTAGTLDAPTPYVVRTYLCLNTLHPIRYISLHSPHPPMMYCFLRCTAIPIVTWKNIVIISVISRSSSINCRSYVDRCLIPVYRALRDAIVDLSFLSLLHERENNGNFRKDYKLRIIDTGDPTGSDEIHLISL